MQYTTTGNRTIDRRSADCGVVNDAGGQAGGPGATLDQRTMQTIRAAAAAAPAAASESIGTADESGVPMQLLHSYRGQTDESDRENSDLCPLELNSTRQFICEKAHFL